MSMSQEEIEALMSGVGDIEEDDSESDSDLDSNPENQNDNVDANVDTNEDDEIVEDVNIDDMLAGIDGIVEDGTSEEIESSDTSDDVKIENLIDANQYPLPAKAENKVVNQLNEVAEDSEEKASQIFDVLSFILDENNEAKPELPG